MSKKKKENFLASEIEKELNGDARPDRADVESAETESGKDDTKEKKPSKIKAVLHSRKFSRGWLAAAVIAVFLACVIAVNIIASALESRFPSLSVDITSSNMYQLQEDTKKLCKSIDKDITIYVLAEEDEFTSYDNSYSTNGTPYFTQANQFLKEIAAMNSRIKLVYKDVASDPSFANNYSDLSLTGSSIVCILDAGDGNYKGLEMGDLFTTEYDESYGYQYITASTVEQAVCTAMLSLTQKEAVKACFVTSSGIPAESDSSTGTSSYTVLKTLLKNQAYTVSTVDLDSKQEVPEDCDILIMVYPTMDISQTALDKVTAFLDSAKTKSKTFVYVPGVYEIEDGTPNLDAFLEENGMVVGSSWIYEQSNKYLTSVYADDNRISVFDYSNQDYTSGINTASRVVMANTRPITFTSDSNAVSLLDTSKKADLLPLTAQSIEDVEDGGGDVISGAAINKSQVSDGVTKNVMVLGSYYAVSDLLTSMPQYNNSDYFTNLFNTVTENEAQVVSITSAKASDTSIGLESSSQITVPSVIFLGVLPIGVLVLGIVIWAVRRKK